MSAKELLHKTTLKEFLRGGGASVHTLKSTDCVEFCLRELATFHISSAPVIDQVTLEYVGIIDASDILHHLVEVWQAAYPELLSAQVDTKKRLTVNELELSASDFLKKSCGELMHAGDVWFRGHKSSFLNEVVEHGFRVHLASHTAGQRPTSPRHRHRVHHRIAVFDILAGEETPDGPVPTWRISNICSQTDVINWLAREAEQGDAILDATIADAGLISTSSSSREPVVTIDAASSALEAYAKMHMQGLSGLAVVDSKNNNKLIGSISLNDLRGLTPQTFGSLAMPVATFLLIKHGRLAWADALLLLDKDNAGDTHDAESIAALKDYMVAVDGCTTTVRQAIEKMAELKAHRCYVLGKDGISVSGVFTPTDILCLFVNTTTA